jgi:ATP-dependent protease ClpP protease subunit
MEKILKKSLNTLSKPLPFVEIFTAKPARMVEWIGSVNNDNLERTLARVKELMLDNPTEEIQLLINSHGGATGIGMAFRDTVNSVLKASLTTIGSGDVDSSGVTLLLAGQNRYLTKNTTLLLHLAGRTFGIEKRFSTEDMENILKEDRLKDYQYVLT